jgi:3',5'-cyclic AMP phosphodiesterase CpdA
MRKVIHLSDLHFGRADMRLAAVLLKTVRDIKPDVVVISGDLTQRATKEEFMSARQFIDELPVPRIIVPGNHDIPIIYDLRRRFIDPFKAWKEHISPDLEPSFADDEIALFGVNTTHPWSIRDGRVSLRQAERLRQSFLSLDPKIVKVVIAHHPFDVPEGHARRIPKGAKMLLETLAHSGVDIFLAGHLHRAHSGHSSDRYQMADHSTLLIHAGTAISTRRRNEANSFNLLIIEKPHLTVLAYTWNNGTSSFEAVSTQGFVHGEEGWRKEAEL